MKMSKSILISSYILLASFCQAQDSISSIEHLSEVTVYSSRLSKFSVGNKIEVLDSLLLDSYSSANLADILSNESQVFIKSYGLGSLATTSFRGAGSSHTAILWNGFNIQRPNLGMIDMALVPVTFLNDIQLQYGGNGALWGSGAVGGTIHLNNKAQFDNGFSVMASTSIGSFSDIQEQLNISISKKKFSTSFKVFNQNY